MDICSKLPHKNGEYICVQLDQKLLRHFQIVMHVGNMIMNYVLLFLLINLLYYCMKNKIVIFLMLVFIFIILYFLFTNENVYYSKIENNNNNSLESNIYNYKTDNDKFIYN